MVEPSADFAYGLVGSQLLLGLVHGLHHPIDIFVLGSSQQSITIGLVHGSVLLELFYLATYGTLQLRDLVVALGHKLLL